MLQRCGILELFSENEWGLCLAVLQVSYRGKRGMGDARGSNLPVWYMFCMWGRKLRLKVSQLLWRLQSIFAEGAICISLLIFRISVIAEESKQASDNFIVVMNHVPGHSNCDLWVRGIFKLCEFVDKTCPWKEGKKKRKKKRKTQNNSRGI